VVNEYVTPALSCIIQGKLGAKCPTLDINAACAGFIYAMDMAEDKLRCKKAKNILIVCAEEPSRMVSWQNRSTCVLFGDGAGAAVVGVVEEGHGVLGIELGADGSGGKFLIQPAGGSRKPATPETAAAYEHTIHMSGQDVFKFAIQIMGTAAKRALKAAGLKEEDLDLLVPHQANMRIISSAAKRLKMPMEKVWVNVDKYANTSAASIPIALCEAQAAGALKKGDNILLVGFGAGLTWASIVLKWSK
jgi:3-oxoacyl-[acyl-carrier-protein] synthase-3